MDKAKKIIKIYFSYQKELKWLEEMAENGWDLDNISMGMLYRFVRKEPRRTVYDIDRFHLSKKPSLEEIRRKEMFMEMACEMGWKEVTHDASMVYYFSKEYEENGVNCLHNDEESRIYRAEKFREYLVQEARKLIFCAMVTSCMCFLLIMLGSQVEWFYWFAMVYMTLCNIQALVYWRFGVNSRKELALTREEWERSKDPSLHKTVHRLLLTNRGLNRFLSKQSTLGWTLTGVTPTRYYFERCKGTEQVYTMDSKWLVNRRRRAHGEKKIEDAKDFSGLNNDWEIQSLHDAEERGWSFVCALENRSIIYKGEAGMVTPLNDAKYDNSLRWISLIGQYGFILLLCGMLGAVIGFISELLGF